MPPNRSERAVLIKTPERVSKLAPALRFPLLVLLSFTFSSLLYSLSSQILGTAGDLAAVSRKLGSWWEVSALLGWRTCELALGWWGGYDGIDLAALNALSHGPPAYLLGTFYGVRATTVISSLLIDTLTTALPMHLLRPLSPEHSSESRLPAEEKDVISSLSIQALTTILGTVIYSTTLFGAYTSFLPTSLVTYFEGIPTIAPAHAARPETLFPVMLVMGLAAKSFIFTPAAATRLNLEDIKHKAFNPQTATLWDTLVYNTWGYSAKTKVVIRRTLTIMLASGMNTFIQTLVTIAGVEAKGAAAYSSVWVVASLLTGAGYGIITDV